MQLPRIARRNVLIAVVAPAVNEAVERGSDVFKQWQGSANRYDELALTYRGGVVLRAIAIWLRRRRDKP